MRALVFCTTCRFSAKDAMSGDGTYGGEVLARQMEGLLAERGRSDVQVARQKCLWSCTRHCNVWFRDDERFSYLAGDFAPERDSAEAILAWFDLHGDSDIGHVRFRDWPQAMKGHFIARMPCFGGDDEA